MNDSIRMDLHLFDGEGAPAAAEGGQGETMAMPGVANRAKSGDLSNVVYGKVEAQDAAAPAKTETAGSDAGSGAEAETLTPEAQKEALRQEYKELTQGKFRDLYTEDTQRIIDRRFKETKTLEAQMDTAKPILDALAQRYGVDAGDLKAIAAAVERDDAMLEDAADAAGMTVDQYRKFQRLTQENRQLQQAQKLEEERAQQRQTAEKWYQEATELKKKFKDFDLKTELADPNFMASLQAGVPMELVYQGKYFDKYMTSATAFAATQAQKATVENIRAKGQRPAENGTASQSAFTTKSDPSKLSLKDFEEIARRVAHGERISF